MEESKPIITEEGLKELKLFKKSFIIFLIGQIILIISTLNYATSINGVPRIFTYFSLFEYVASILFFISLLLIRNINISFKHSMYALVIYIAIELVYRICLTSQDSLYLALGRGLYWSVNILFCIFFLYYLNGCNTLFKKYKFTKGIKHSRLTYIIFGSAFLLEMVFEYLSTTRLVLSNTFFNRFFLYGGWGFEFILYTFTFIVSIVAMKYIYLKIKKKEVLFKQDEEQREIQTNIE